VLDHREQFDVPDLAELAIHVVLELAPADR
jgi:hypothetical protein